MMRLRVARLETLAGHLLWRLSWGLLPGRRAGSRAGSTVSPVTETETFPAVGKGLGGNMTHSSPLFASRIAGMQQDAGQGHVEENNRQPAEQRESGGGMYVLFALLVLALAVGSFFL